MNDIISHLLLGYFVLVPAFVILASHSLKYYVSRNKVSEKAIELFLNNICFPLRPFFTEQSAYNLFVHNHETSVAKYLLISPAIPSMRIRIFWGAFCIIVIIAIGINLTKQEENIWIITDILLIVAHSISLYWSWSFGSKIILIEAQLHN